MTRSYDSTFMVANMKMWDVRLQGHYYSGHFWKKMDLYHDYNIVPLFFKILDLV